MHWAHRVRHRFPDGQLYLNLHGFDPAGTVVHPAEAIRRFLDVLEVPPARIPTDLDAQAALYRTLLADRRMLILLDNARDAEQVRPLLPGAPGCLVVVTSRHHLSGLVATEGAHPVALDLLATEEARGLLTRRLGAERTAAEPAAVDEIITHCARLPLALTIAAARAATHPGFPLHALAAELRDARDRLDALAGDDPATDVRAVFSWSYRTLSPTAARLFRLLALHPGPDFGPAAAASLAGVAPPVVRRLLAELVAAHLIGEHAPGRYGFHDLLRAYATEQVAAARPGAPTGRAHAVAEDSGHPADADDPRAATHRLLDQYLHTAHGAAMRLNPARDPLRLPPPRPGVTLDVPADHLQAMAWFTTEHAVLLAAIGHAASAGFDTHVWQLTWTLVHFLDRRGHWHDWASAQRAALAAAQRLADPMAEAVAHRFSALADIQMGRFDDAYTHLGQARARYQRAGDRAGLAHTHIHLGLAEVRQGRDDASLAHCELALDLFRTAGHQAGQALALNNIGWLRAQRGDYAQALVTCRSALALQQRLHHRDEKAATWDSLGYIHHHLGHHDEALTCYRHALDLRRDIGDRFGEASTLIHLGDVRQAAGDPVGARTAWRHAVAILDDLDHPDAEQIRVRLDEPGAPGPGTAPAGAAPAAPRRCPSPSHLAT